jgi:phosphatidylinositol 4-kinase
LYKEIKEKETQTKISLTLEEEKNTEKNKEKKSKLNKLINLGKQMRSLSLNEISFFRNHNLVNLQNKYGNPFGEPWSEITQKIKSTSPYRNFPSHTIKSFIAKSDDDLRQESLAMQLIKMMADIFKKANINLSLTTYEIIITSRTSGLIEFIPDSISIDGLKKKTGSDLNTFYRNFFLHHFKEAQKNFAESLAAYSLVTYILNIKDRHNGNIMIDIQGKIIHIDFGFILGISPGNVGFETAPFKMTKEYVNLLDGINSEMYKYFLSILTKGFLEIRKYFDSFVKVIEIMGIKSDMPCFAGRDINIVIRDFIARFHLDKNEKEINELMVLLAKNSINSWRTYQYDVFQQLTNGIKP